MKIWLVILLGIILRGINLDQSLWLDEATSIRVAREFSFQQIVTTFSPGDFHPPLYYFLLKIWISVFGASEVAARSLSVLLGSATIPLVFLIGRKLVSKNAGLAAALFFATAPLHIYYSQEARMYAAATFFATLFVWFFLKSLKEKKLFTWLGLLLSGIFLAYTHYLTITLLGVALCYLLLQQKQLKKNLYFWLSLFILIPASFLPWTPIFLKQIQSAALAKINTPLWWDVLGKTSLKQLALVPIKFLAGRISFYNKILYTLFVLPPLVLSALLLWRSIFKKSLFLWLWLLVPLVFSALFGWISSGFSYFRLLFILPAFYLLITVGIYSLKSKKTQRMLVGVFVLMNLVSASIYLFNPRFHREDWRSAVQFIEENSQGQNTAAIFVTRNQREPYLYYTKSVPSYGPERVEDSSYDYDKIWLVRYVQPIFDPEDKIRARVEESYLKIKEHDFNGVVVWEYKNLKE